MLIGNSLKRLRESKKLTVEQVTEHLSISSSSYRKYEYNEREPSTDVVIEIADFYGVTTDYLLGREPEKNPIAMLNLAIGEKEALEMYIKLPEEVRQIIIDTMIQLGEAAKNAKCFNNEVSDANVVIVKNNDIKPNTYPVKTAARRGVDGKHSPITTEYLTAEEISDIINAEDADDNL